MMDESGFLHLRLELKYPDFSSAARGLNRLFQHPDVTAAMLGAGVAGHEPVFYLTMFGPASRVQELLARASDEGGEVRVVRFGDSAAVALEAPEPEPRRAEARESSSVLLEVL